MRATIRRAQLLCGGTVVMSLLGFGLPGLGRRAGAIAWREDQPT